MTRRHHIGFDRCPLCGLEVALYDEGKRRPVRASHVNLKTRERCTAPRGDEQGFE